MDETRHQAILLPGVVLPAEPAYADLVRELGPRADARYKDLELYAGDRPTDGPVIEAEIEGIDAFADRCGFDRFHLVGYSAGGACALAYCNSRPERLLSLSLNEPAWIGNQGWTPGEAAVWEEAGRIAGLPLDELMPRFIRMQLAPGVETPPAPEGPPPPWMAKRPDGIKALTRGFASSDIDLMSLRSFQAPVLFTLGGRSNPDYFGAMGRRLSEAFPDFTMEVYEDRHHFDPPHRAEPARLAESLLSLWRRAEPTA